MPKNRGMLLAFTGLLSVFFTACSKKEPLRADNDTQSVADHALAENAFLSVAAISVKHAANTTGLSAFGKRQCDSLKLVSGDTQWSGNGHVQPEFIYDLSSGCVRSGTDKISRSGSVYLYPASPLSAPGARVRLMFFNVTAGDFSLSCDSLVLALRNHNGDSTSCQAMLYNGSVKQGTATIKYSFSRSLQFSSTGDVKAWGASSGMNRHGKKFSVLVSAALPLVKPYHCRFLTAGQAELSPDGVDTRTVDFGKGECDDHADYRVNNNTIAFRLK